MEPRNKNVRGRNEGWASVNKAGNKAEVKKSSRFYSFVLPSQLLHRSVGANLDFALSLTPYLINTNGTGKARAAMPPSKLNPPPIPSLLIMGCTAKGSPAANTLRRKVFAATADAAYSL
jgi:hypothetical protein